ncbi:hypothetical protein I4U23_013054 [Adineta vaga]|nr:hypothetical protein I4U23_013054 [Adineta vaga]
MGIVLLNYISYNDLQDDETEIKRDENSIPSESIKIKADYESSKIPAVLQPNSSDLDVSDIRIRTYTIRLKENKTRRTKISVREAGQGDYHILLLHGQKFSSKIWHTLGTLQYLGKWGYRAIAIDLPKRKNVSLSIDDDQEAIEWMKKLIKSLRLSNLVIISPCKSGDLVLPYIFQLQKTQELVRAFVPIAPTGTERFPNDDYRQVNIPTLVVHAEKDSLFQPAYELLIKIPKSEVLFMIDAGHDSYADTPLFFHNGLRKFLYDVYRPIYNGSL